MFVGKKNYCWLEYEDRINKKFTFFIESVDSVDAGTLMVSSQEEEIFWVLDLIGEEQSDSFQRLFTSINIISPIIKFIIKYIIK